MATVNVAYAPWVLSTSQLMRKTTTLICDKGKIEGTYLKIPSETWMKYQFIPNNPFKKSSLANTDILKYIHILQSRNERDDSNPWGYWCSFLKKNWRYSTSRFNPLVGDYLWDEQQSKTPVLDPVDAFWKIGVNDKTSVPVGRKVHIALVQNRLFKLLFYWGQQSKPPITAGVVRNWIKCHPSHAKFSRSWQISLSGKNEGIGSTFVSIHDATLDPSSGTSLLFFLWINQIIV